jgi:UDP-N-acetylglucosamine:LPS N-acetylglucosamine transferase
VIVPARDVSEDHQVSNARELEGKGAAVCHVDGGDTSGDERLFARVAALAGDDTALAGLGARMRAVARPEATGRIVGEVLRLAGRGPATQVRPARDARGR